MDPEEVTAAVGEVGAAAAAVDEADPSEVVEGERMALVAGVGGDETTAAADEPSATAACPQE